MGRHAAMSVSSASAVTITLLIISIFMIVTGNMQEVTQNIEGSVKISAFVAYDHEEQSQLDMIQATIKNLEHVVSVEYSSKDQEFDELMETYEDESAREALETYREDNPLHDAFYVEVNDGDALKDTAEKIQAIEGIETVNYGGDSALMFVQALNSVRFGGAILVAGLSALAIFLIANTIKLTIYARSNEIAIMRDVGATNGFIRAPFVVEGMIIGAPVSYTHLFISVWGTSFGIDKMLTLGGGNAKAVQIISEAHAQINAAIQSELDRGTTLSDATGGYTGAPRKVILVVVEKKEYPKLLELVNRIDENAFMITSDATDVHGEGFTLEFKV